LTIWANHDDIIDRIAWARYVNRATAALRDIFGIVKHFQSPFPFHLSYILYRHCQKKEIEKKRFSFGMIFAGGSLARYLLVAAILADFARFLPFWQSRLPT
jgi:hypothetical protein